MFYLLFVCTGNIRHLRTKSFVVQFHSFLVLFSFHSAPPTILEPLSDMKVVLGSELLLKVLLDGFPQPKIFWKKDNSKISSPCYKFDSEDLSCLRVESVTEQLKGTYSITAKNIGGEVTSSCTVHVQGIKSNILLNQLVACFFKMHFT